MKKLHSTDEELIKKLENQIDEFEKGLDKRTKDKDEEIFDLKLKLGDAENQIRDYEIFEKNNNKVLSAVEEIKDDR